MPDVARPRARGTKASELAAIPPLLERLGTEDGLKGALVSIDAIATNPAIAEAIAAQGADGLLAVKANQPTLRAEVEAAFAAAGDGLETHVDLEKGHGRLEQRRMAVLRDLDWLDGERRFPGELRLPGAVCLLRAETRVETREATRTETRYFIASRALTAPEAAKAVRGHWAIENRLHWVLDVTFGDDQSRLRKGHGARNMATIRHFALNLVRAAARQALDQVPAKACRLVPGLSSDNPRITAHVNLDSEPWTRGQPRGRGIALEE